VRIISRKRLRKFRESRTHDADRAKIDLNFWRTTAEHVDWDNFASLKQTFGSADRVGNCVVFDVGGNRFRLIGRVMFDRRIVYVLKVMDHPEYDKKKWIDECSCRKPPPKKIRRVTTA